MSVCQGVNYWRPLSSLPDRPHWGRWAEQAPIGNTSYSEHLPRARYIEYGGTQTFRVSSTHESYKSFHYHLLSFNPELFHVYRCSSLSSCSQKPFERIWEWRVWSIHSPLETCLHFFLINVVRWAGRELYCISCATPLIYSYSTFELIPAEFPEVYSPN